MVGSIHSTNYSSGSYGSSPIAEAGFSRSVSNGPNGQSFDVKSILGQIKCELSNIETLLDKLVTSLCGGAGSGGSGNDAPVSSGSGGTGDVGTIVKGLKDEVGSIKNTLSQIGQNCGSNGGVGGGYDTGVAPRARGGECPPQFPIGQAPKQPAP